MIPEIYIKSIEQMDRAVEAVCHAGRNTSNEEFRKEYAELAFDMKKRRNEECNYLFKLEMSLINDKSRNRSMPEAETDTVG